MTAHTGIPVKTRKTGPYTEQSIENRSPAMNEQQTKRRRDEEQKLRREAVRRLRNVVDPETGLNIVDMGLLYQVHVFRNGEHIRLEVHMGLTTPACPMKSHLEQQVAEALTDLGQVNVQTVMNPPWSPEMMDTRITFPW